MRHKNRTIKGDELRRKHQERYEKWWLGKVATKINFMEINPPQKITSVEYIGNSVYGIVQLYTEDGKEYTFSGFDNGFRPQKYLVEVLENRA